MSKDPCKNARRGVTGAAEAGGPYFKGGSLPWSLGKVGGPPKPPKLQGTVSVKIGAPRPLQGPPKRVAPTSRAALVDGH